MKLVLAGMLISMSAIASELPEPSFKQFYVNESGSRLESTDALLRSVKGETVYKCQTVEAKVSKSGSSIGMKNVKKPKVIK